MSYQFSGRNNYEPALPPSDMIVLGINDNSFAFLRESKYTDSKDFGRIIVEKITKSEVCRN